LKKGIIATLVIMSVFGVSCSDKMKRLLVSTGIGCTAGLAVGAVYDEVQRKKEGNDRKQLQNAIGNIFKERKKQNKGKIVGLATGCLAGLGVGFYLNTMYDDMSDTLGKEGIRLEKIQERGETTALKVNMDGGISFEDGRSDLKGVGKTNVDKLSEALLAYPETKIDIEGHANRTGTESVNQKLSESRAKTVAGLMKDNGLESGRVGRVVGYGSANPMKGVDPKDGSNRRVEVFIVPQS
jgi:outer membrane protein OmpA-like peptidoglycan-associated protein